MAGGVNRKISAASARAHTRRAKQNNSLKLPPGIFSKILLLLLVGILAWAYQVIRPPPPKICGSPDGPPVTASRIKLRDGRHLAYKEHGVTRDLAKFKIIVVHGFRACRHNPSVANHLSPEIVKELGVYLVSFDRPGYGESDPHPKRTLKSLALDIEELADQLGLGSKFYVIGYSMGGELTWSCLKYIPHRLAGVTLLAPVINYWWPGFPANQSNEAYNQQFAPDQWALRVAHYTPWLTYWWNTQKWFSGSTVMASSPDLFSHQDKEVLAKLSMEKSYMFHGISAKKLGSAVSGKFATFLWRLSRNQLVSPPSPPFLSTSDRRPGLRCDQNRLTRRLSCLTPVHAPARELFSSEFFTLATLPPASPDAGDSSPLGLFTCLARLHPSLVNSSFGSTMYRQKSSFLVDSDAVPMA